MVPMAVIATDICQNFGDTTRKYFGDHLVNLINVYKDLHIFLRNEISVKTIILPSDNIVQLPCDFVKETSVGNINCDGRIAVMSVDRKLRVPPTIQTDTDLSNVMSEVFNEEIGAPDFPFYNYWDGGNVGELYGYSKSINLLGYYNINRTDNTLMISPSCPHSDNDFVLEYFTDGVSDGVKFVPTELVNCLTDGAKERFCLDKSDPRHAVYGRKYELGFKNAKRLYLARPIDYYAEIFKQNHQYAPK